MKGMQTVIYAHLGELQNSKPLGAALGATQLSHFDVEQEPKSAPQS